MSAEVRARLVDLLSVEAILGVASIDAAGQIESCINLADRDAASLYEVLSAAIGNFGHGEAWADVIPSFATFAMREGQIAFSGSPQRSLIALTDPDVRLKELKVLLHGTLADLAQVERRPFVSPTAPTAPLV